MQRDPNDSTEFATKLATKFAIAHPRLGQGGNRVPCERGPGNAGIVLGIAGLRTAGTFGIKVE